MNVPARTDLIAVSSPTDPSLPLSQGADSYRNSSVWSAPSYRQFRNKSFLECLASRMWRWTYPLNVNG